MYRPEITVFSSNRSIKQDFTNENDAMDFIRKYTNDDIDISKKGITSIKCKDFYLFIFNFDIIELCSMELWKNDIDDIEYIILENDSKFIIINRNTDKEKYYCQKWNIDKTKFKSRRLTPFKKNNKRYVSISGNQYCLEKLIEKIKSKYDMEK